MQKVSALYPSSSTSSVKQLSYVDTKLQEARSRVAFPLPNVLLLFHADGFYNLRGDPQCNLQLSDEIKYQLLFAASAHKDDKGIAHLGENFTVQLLSVHDLVLLYRVLNSYLSQDRYQSSGRGVFHRHTYEIEKQLQQLCASGPAKKDEVLGELKGWHDSTLDTLILRLSTSDSVLARMNACLIQWCEEKAGSPEYLDRIITFAKLVDDYLKKGNTASPSEKDVLLEQLQAELQKDRAKIEMLLGSIVKEVCKKADIVSDNKQLKAKIEELEEEREELEIFLQQLLEKDKSEKTKMDGDTERRVQNLFDRFASLNTDKGATAEIKRLAEENIALGRSHEFELQRKVSLVKKATGHIEQLEDQHSQEASELESKVQLFSTVLESNSRQLSQADKQILALKGDIMKLLVVLQERHIEAPKGLFYNPHILDKKAK